MMELVSVEKNHFSLGSDNLKKLYYFLSVLAVMVVACFIPVVFGSLFSVSNVERKYELNFDKASLLTSYHMTTYNLNYINCFADISLVFAGSVDMISNEPISFIIDIYHTIENSQHYHQVFEFNNVLLTKDQQKLSIVRKPIINFDSVKITFTMKDKNMSFSTMDVSILSGGTETYTIRQKLHELIVFCEFGIITFYIYKFATTRNPISFFLSLLASVSSFVLSFFFILTKGIFLQTIFFIPFLIYRVFSDLSSVCLIVFYIHCLYFRTKACRNNLSVFVVGYLFIVFCIRSFIEVKSTGFRMLEDSQFEAELLSYATRINSISNFLWPGFIIWAIIYGKYQRDLSCIYYLIPFMLFVPYSVQYIISLLPGIELYSIPMVNRESKYFLFSLMFLIVSSFENYIISKRQKNVKWELGEIHAESDDSY